jgi:cyclopropane fatty-acyl-phospholipid synthase-like methyltransferase
MSKIQNTTNIDSYNDLYSTMEHDHEYPNINLVRLEKWHLKTPGYVLDHGCGYGENLIFLTKKGYKVHGVEINEKLVKWVELKCKIKQVPLNQYSLELSTSDNKIAQDDETFDHVISLGVLEMLGDKGAATQYVNELSRVLKPGGKMLVSTLHPENSFVVQSSQIGSEQFSFSGKEMDKETQLKYELYIPNNSDSFAGLFPESCYVDEIGLWNNVYCGVNGKHYCALITKKITGENNG